MFHIPTTEEMDEISRQRSIDTVTECSAMAKGGQGSAAPTIDKLTGEFKILKRVGHSHTGIDRENALNELAV